MNQTNIDGERRWSTCLIAGTAVAIVHAIFCAGAFYYIVTPPSPEQVFERATGYRWPSNANIISTGNTGLVTDGEFHVVFSVDETTISQWLRVQPAAPVSNWQSGPVPTEIGFHCAFGSERGLYLTRDNPNEKMHYAGDPELVDLVSSDEIVYCAHERRYGANPIPWHNGTLLIVDPRTNKVWLSIWDF